MLKHRLITQRFAACWGFWIRGAVILALLSVLIPMSAINPSRASASPPMPAAPRSAYNCTTNPIGGHCYGVNRWSGHTFGASTYEYIHSFTCSDCNTSTHYHLNATLWVADTQYYPSATVEVGYGAIGDQGGGMWYYWASTPPFGSQEKHYVAQIPSGDYGGYTGYKITRNRQDAAHVVVGIWSANYGFSTVAINPMGASTWLGYNMDIGMELSANNDGTVIRHSSGDNIYLRQNMWQMSNGTYVYQNTNGNLQPLNGPINAYWQTQPVPGGTGGQFSTYCGC